jgi:signal transduction histidine kinase
MIVVGASALAVALLVVTWGNSRRLANRAGSSDRADRIERVADPPGSASEAADARLREHATMLSATVRSALAQLDEVRLPVHILLEAKFGDLNDNQEELLGTARDAADAMDSALRRLAQVADADRGVLPVQRELVQVNDVVRAVLPLARAAAERREARLDVSLEPGLPRVMADRVRLAEALALLTEAATSTVGPERPLRVSTAREQRQAVVSIAPPRADGSADHDVVLARRLVEAQGGTVEQRPDVVRIRVG